MSNVITFRRPLAHAPQPQARRGATLFVNIRKTSLIAHLAKPQGHRMPLSEKAGRS